MAIVMFDSVSVDQIPSDAQAVAGYTSGLYPTYASLAAKFPDAYRLSIAVNAGENADALDVENGDATVADAPGWYARQRARGITRPCLYASAGTMNALIGALQHAGISRSAVRLWSAHYGDGAHVCAPGSCAMTSTGMDGTQWTDAALQRNLDESLLLDGFFTTVPPSGPPAATVAVWVAAGEGSLAGMCSGIFRNAVSTVLRLTAEHSPGELFSATMASYINQVMAPATEKVPAGVTVWHPAGSTVTHFTSRGDQTLQGLGLAWDCGPSAIIRCTAENTPGGVFEAAFAACLDSVFAASVVKVPAGTSLYYQK